MQQQVSMNRFFEGGAKRRHQGGRQFTDEAYRIGHHNLSATQVPLPQMHPARGGVESGKQLIGGIRTGFGQGIEQGRFTGIGIAHQRDRKHPPAAARAPLHLTLTL